MHTIDILSKIRLDVSSESSARQRTHTKNQALVSSKDKSKKLKCRLLQFLFGALRVNLLRLEHACGAYTNSADQVQALQNAASDQAPRL